MREPDPDPNPRPVPLVLLPGLPGLAAVALLAAPDLAAAAGLLAGAALLFWALAAAHSSSSEAALTARAQAVGRENSGRNRMDKVGCVNAVSINHGVLIAEKNPVGAAELSIWKLLEPDYSQFQHQKLLKVANDWFNQL